MSRNARSIVGRRGSPRASRRADGGEFPESAEVAPATSASVRQRVRRPVHAVSGAIEESRVASDWVVETFLRRARRAGVEEILLDRGRRLASTLSMIESVAYFRILVKINDGAIDQVGPLMRKLEPDRATPAEFAAIVRMLGAGVDSFALPEDRHDLIEQLADLVAAEVDSTGGSSIFQWLAVHGAYELDDPELRDYAHHRIERALRFRQAAERPTATDDVAADRAALLAAVVRHGNGRVFVCGTTLLAHETGRPQHDPTTLEFGTFEDLRDLARLLEPSPVVLLRHNDHRLIVALPDGRTTGTIELFDRGDDVVSHGDGIVTRWHTPFELTVRDDLGPIPADTDRYLSERFGNWMTPTLFYDDLLDAPNTTFDDSLESMFALSRRAQNSISRGIRHYADATSEQLRDVFDIDVSMFVPQPAHPKALSLPFAARDLADRPVVVLADEFERVDARTIRDIEALADETHRLVLAVRDTPGSDDGVNRMMILKTLKTVDHVVLYDGVETLLDDVDELGAGELVIGRGAAATVAEIRREGLRVVAIGDRIGSEQ